MKQKGVSGRENRESNPLLPEEKKKDTLGNGALEAGGEIDVLNISRMGYLCQYFAVGMLSTAIRSMAYGLYICYLNVPSYVSSSQQAIIDMAWSFKILFALISDSFPVFGCRRKPYMAFGWSIASICLGVIAWSMPLPPAYYCMGSDRKYNTSAVCNEDASKDGASYAALMWRSRRAATC